MPTSSNNADIVALLSIQENTIASLYMLKNTPFPRHKQSERHFP